MGKNNRERRREKQRARAESRRNRERQAVPTGGTTSRRAGHAAPPGRSSRDGWFDGPGPHDGHDGMSPSVHELVNVAAGAVHGGFEAQVERITATLADATATPQARHLVEQGVAAVLTDGLGYVWHDGWQPADLVRVVGRRLGRSHRDLVATAIVVQNAMYAPALVDPRWSDQVRALAEEMGGGPEPEPDSDDPSWVLRAGQSRRGAIRAAVEVVALVRSLPSLPRLCPLPGQGSSLGQPGHHVDEGVLRRVRALLAKAESTTFEEESQALTTKAQELMSRHSIDRAALGVASGEREAPLGLRLGVDDPYAQSKAILLAIVAGANRCQAVWSKGFGFSTVFGFAEDLEIVELLYTSLLVQATVAMTAFGSRRSTDGRSRTRSFRQAFLLSYATRIGQRLDEAAAATEEEAVQEHGTSLLPLLADRRSAVEEEASAAFPEVSYISGPRAVDEAGWRAGHAAANLASLWGAAEVEGTAAEAADDEAAC